MASQVILKKSSVAARVPVAGDLAYGELALNYTDGLLYFKKSDDTISSFSGTSSSTGTVTSVSALTIGTTGADVSSTVSNSSTTPTITLNIPTASASNRGVLSAADWSTFNSKLSSYTEADTLATVTGRGASTSTAVTFSGGITGNLTGNASGLSAILAVASGGTGTATPALVAGTNVTISGTWPNQTINSTAVGGGDGTVTSVAALTLGTSGTDVSSTVATGTTTPVITLNIPTASATARGLLSAANWTTFNNKLSSYTETDTLATVTTRGATTSNSVKFTGSMVVGTVVDNSTLSTLLPLHALTVGVSSSNAIPSIALTSFGLAGSGYNKVLAKIKANTWDITTTAASFASISFLNGPDFNNIGKGQIVFSTNDTDGSTADTEKMRLTYTGLGVGTSTPTQKLEVAGTIYSTSGGFKFPDGTTQVTVGELTANKGAANGYAPLDATSKIAATYLPSYVDDVLEYANLAAFPATGETGKIYITLDDNKTYRWSGTVYIVITASPGSTDSVTEGSTNLYFTNARARAAISATQNISYDSATGVFTGPVLTGYLTTESDTLETVTARGATTTTAISLSVTDNTNAALKITQLGTGNALLIEDSTSPDSTPLVVDATGRLIVGATSAGSFGALIQGRGLNAFAAVYDGNDGSPPIFDFFKSRAGAIVATNDDVGRIAFSAYDGVSAYSRAAQILVEIDGTPAVGSMPGRIILSTTPSGSTTPVERLRIANSGDISLLGGTANGVAYLNASKVITTGTALTFDGTTLTTGTVYATSGGFKFPDGSVQTTASTGGGGGSSGGTTAVTNITRTATGTGSQATFTVTSGVTVDSVIVTENGILQTPTTDYTVSGTTLTFTTAPASGVTIQIRELGSLGTQESISPFMLMGA